MPSSSRDTKGEYVGPHYCPCCGRKCTFERKRVNVRRKYSLSTRKPERLADFVEKYLTLRESGEHDSERVAEILDIHHNTLFSRLKRAGLKWSDFPAPGFPEEYEEMKSIGLSDPQIAERLGILEASLRRKKYRHGLG